jgi:hypothetical protein
MAVGRAHGIAVDALRLDLRSPTAFEGVIHPHDQRPGGSKNGDQEKQQEASPLPAGPDVAVQDAMLRLNGLGVRQAHNP